MSGKVFGDCGFIDVGFFYQQWVIFLLMVQDLNCVFQFFFMVDQGINVVDVSKLIEVGGEVFYMFFFVGLFFIVRLVFVVIGRLVWFVFVCIMRNEVYYIKMVYFMFMQQVGGL